MYSFRQKFFSLVVLCVLGYLLRGEGSGAYLSLKEQNCWLITCQTISSDDIVDEDKRNTIRSQREKKRRMIIEFDTVVVVDILEQRKFLTKIELVTLFCQGGEK